MAYRCLQQYELPNGSGNNLATASWNGYYLYKQGTVHTTPSSPSNIVIYAYTIS